MTERPTKGGLPPGVNNLDPEALGLGGNLAKNVVHFAQFLRRAGMVVGTAQVLDALAALASVGVSRREDVQAALAAVFLSKLDQHELFDQAFETFWRDPFGANEALALLLPNMKRENPGPSKTSRRIRDAYQGPGNRSRPPTPPESPRPDIEIDRRGTVSDSEALQRRDFEQLSAQEEAEVLTLLTRFRFPWRDTPTRRTRPSHSGGRLDLRRTLAASRGTLLEPVSLRFTRKRTRPPPLVVLVDISGSMERYSRMLLHFLHALTSARDRVHVFVFGTQLTNVTRALRHRDVDVAFNEMSERVADWSGGTRIATCLAGFRQDWARRVLGQGAIVLLVTDGLERENAPELGRVAEQLARSCKRLVWLNPLLRWDGYEALAAGPRALLPHVHEHRPVHNLESLHALAEALS